MSHMTRISAMSLICLVLPFLIKPNIFNNLKQGIIEILHFWSEAFVKSLSILTIFRMPKAIE